MWMFDIGSCCLGPNVTTAITGSFSLGVKKLRRGSFFIELLQGACISPLEPETNAPFRAQRRNWAQIYEKKRQYIRAQDIFQGCKDFCVNHNKSYTTCGKRDSPIFADIKIGAVPIFHLVQEILRYFQDDFWE
jgi:hypothetical protein